MSTIEELQQVCAEFSQNFAALSAKHESLGRDLESERAMRRKIEQQLAAALEEVSQFAQAAKMQKEGIDEANQYKERYYATCVAVEHLKGRLEAAKKAIAEKDEEHEAEKEHLHAQMNDLLRRIDSNASSTQIKTLKDRIVQLEEQCALLSGSTIEERERVMQQQLLSNATVRDLQAKVAASDQRLRGSEGEIAQLRGLLRRCSDVQAELTTGNERYESEVGRLKVALEDKSAEAQLWEKRCAGYTKQSEEQLADAQRLADKAIKQMRVEVSTLRDQLDRKTEEFDIASEKLNEYRVSLTKRMNSVKDECHREMDMLQTGKNEVIAEVQRLKWKAANDATHYEDLHASFNLAQQRCEGLEKHVQTLSAQLEATSQRDNFVAAERDGLKNTVATLHMRLAELQSQLAAKEGTIAEGERLKLQLQYNEAELFETRRQLQAAASSSRKLEIDCEKKIKFMFKQVQSKEKKRTSEMANNEELRKRLATESMFVNAKSEPIPRGPLDVLDTLRQQSQQAALLQERLSALAR